MSNSQKSPHFDLAAAICKTIQDNAEISCEKQKQAATPATGYLAMTEELAGAWVALRVVLNKISELQTSFAAIHKTEQPEENIEEIETRICNLEAELETLADPESRLPVIYKIKELGNRVKLTAECGIQRDELQAIFAEISEDLAKYSLPANQR